MTEETEKERQSELLASESNDNPLVSSRCRRKAAAVSRVDHPQVPEQDVGPSIAAASIPTSPLPSTPSGTVGGATTRRPAAFPLIAAVEGRWICDDAHRRLA